MNEEPNETGAGDPPAPDPQASTAGAPYATLASASGDGVANLPSGRAAREQPGSLLGPYRLVRILGSGGMGVVYLAGQQQPVRRSVALKIIKQGMDTEPVIGRFEAERQALALMNHPNIAKVFDAGATEDGRTYFVMELVEGVPITKYCDERRLTVRERLALFAPVCQAIQHAHQKGVIHRDIKPSNVLAADFDGKAVPKVIDFGIAKATGQQLTEATMFTQLGVVVGTLECMSLQQAQPMSMDIGTRSDIYSLGALLYQLLTGVTPLKAAWPCRESPRPTSGPSRSGRRRRKALPGYRPCHCRAARSSSARNTPTRSASWTCSPRPSTTRGSTPRRSPCNASSTKPTAVSVPICPLRSPRKKDWPRSICTTATARGANSFTRTL
jgi:serine/threonine protein kinase